MRHGGSAEQRLWLGPSGYLCGCERRVANTNAYSYADGNSDTNGNGDSNSDRHSNPNREPHCNSIGNGYAATPSIRSASAHTAASTVILIRKLSGKR